jgi:hypothetical protein
MFSAAGGGLNTISSAPAYSFSRAKVIEEGCEFCNETSLTGVLLFIFGSWPAVVCV